MSDTSQVQDPPHFTSTEMRILYALRDGEAHRTKDLMVCLPDELSGSDCLRQHVRHIRAKIRPYGLTIICVSHGRGTSYQKVRIAGIDDNPPNVPTD